MRRVVLLLLIAGVVAGCTSPETLRTRGGGPGADVGNRPEVVRMHGGSRPYWKTPVRIAVDHPPLDPARQAQQLSRR
jgi:uncharacterized protein YceK